MTHYIPFIAALILPWLPSYRSRGGLILAILVCYGLLLLSVYLYHIGLKQQLDALTGGKEFFTPTPQTEALVTKLTHGTARRLAPITSLLPAILYPLLIALAKRGYRRKARTPQP